MGRDMKLEIVSSETIVGIGGCKCGAFKLFG
jgi:hypothetical protein